MTNTIEVSKEVYNWLVEGSTRRGCTIEQFLEWKLKEDRKERDREAAFHNVNDIWQHMSETYGRQPDGVDSIREDRDR